MKLIGMKCIGNPIVMITIITVMQFHEIKTKHVVNMINRHVHLVEISPMTKKNEVSLNNSNSTMINTHSTDTPINMN